MEPLVPGKLLSQDADFCEFWSGYNTLGFLTFPVLHAGSQEEGGHLGEGQPFLIEVITRRLGLSVFGFLSFSF